MNEPDDGRWRTSSPRARRMRKAKNPQTRVHEDERRAGAVQAPAGAEEEPRADRTADRDHLDLPRLEGLVVPLLLAGEVLHGEHLVADGLAGFGPVSGTFVSRGRAFGHVVPSGRVRRRSAGLDGGISLSRPPKISRERSTFPAIAVHSSEDSGAPDGPVPGGQASRAATTTRTGTERIVVSRTVSRASVTPCSYRLAKL